jgi:hypothetical protein
MMDEIAGANPDEVLRKSDISKTRPSDCASIPVDSGKPLCETV